jgi:hypothetical protein
LRFRCSESRHKFLPSVIHGGARHAANGRIAGVCGEGNRRLYALAIRAGLTVVDLRTLRNDELAAVKIRNIHEPGSLI